MIKGVKPVSTQILVEILTAQETLGTALYVRDDVKTDIPQGRVISWGPQVDAEKLGIKEGDRIIITGSYVPVPKIHEIDKQLGLVEFHTIKGVLVED